MKFVSILYKKRPEEPVKIAPAYFLDLNLDQIVAQVQKQTGDYQVTPLYYQLPETFAEEAYRREIYQDVKQPAVFAALTQFSEGMRKYAKAASNMRQIDKPLQRMAWHAASAYAYCSAVDGLLTALDALPLWSAAESGSQNGKHESGAVANADGVNREREMIRSEGLITLRAYLQEYCASDTYRQLREKATAIHDRIVSLHLTVEIENNKIVVKEGTLSGTYDGFLQTIRETNGEKGSPFMAALVMSPLEEELFGIFRSKFPQLFRDIEAFAKDCPSFCETTFVLLESELQYYLLFWRFEQELQAHGFAFCVPQTDEARAMEANGLYDLALACTNLRQKKPVISNDFAYREDERFFVVNGPNQGGKTTFARSLGQLIYFTKMGLDAPAMFANVHRFSKLLTHFSVEESMETGQGKLMEELRRLAPMMKAESDGAFVIINELFTTAAHYDGCVMGARVLEHFIGSGCRGIYVTHLKELGGATGGVVTMTATLDGSSEHKRTFKILRNKPEDVGYAEDIVKKYALTYEQLKERLCI